MNSLRSIVRALVFAAPVMLASACSSTGAGRDNVTVRPFPAELTRVFDDGADYVKNVEELGGRVATDWRTQVEALCREADVVFPVRAETLTTGDDNAQSRAYGIIMRITGRPLRGTAPADGRIVVSTSDASPGYNTVRGNVNRLQAREYLLFGRWYHDSDGNRRIHWHVSPNTPTLQQRVRDAVGYVDPGSPTERVVRRN